MPSPEDHGSLLLEWKNSYPGVCLIYGSRSVFSRSGCETATLSGNSTSSALQAA
jgi:hypothetical protein